jgi:hypothetical protein
MNGPINGPSTIDGIIAAMMAVESIVAEPVSLARYHASANPTTWLPNMENAWLAHITKNFLIAVTPSWDFGYACRTA